ncbi:MAG: cytochrome c [Acidobacteriota bacterium]
MKRTKLILLAAACIVFTYACSQTSVTNTTNSVNSAANRAAANTQPTVASDAMAAGHDLYKSSCAACHREDGTGGKITLEGKTINPENLTADKFKNRSDEKLIGYITDGNDEGMPAFKDKLKPEEIKEVVKYIRGELQKK